VRELTAGHRVALLEDYGGTSDSLRRIYTRAVQRQWVADTAIDWSREVAFGSPLAVADDFSRALADRSPVSRMSSADLSAMRWDLHGWLVSQFLHGEQGALIAASRAVESGPSADIKLCAAMQVADEARHVDVFGRYLRDYLPSGAAHPISPSLGALLDDVCERSEWDLVLLGMQIIVESVASAAFRLAPRMLHDPLILEITDRVSVDEARHVSFGIIALQDVMRELTAAQLRDREDFALESLHAMHQQYLLASVWEHAGADPAQGREFAMHDPTLSRLRVILFSKMTAALRHIGLLTPRITEHLAELGVAG